jgi:alpha-tubulin suppressor-like RCC1 family protein
MYHKRLVTFSIPNFGQQKVSWVNNIIILQAAVGADHVIVVTTERQVFTWGEGSKGQLGHGNMESKVKPELVEALNSKSIFR